MSGVSGVAAYLYGTTNFSDVGGSLAIILLLLSMIAFWQVEVSSMGGCLFHGKGAYGCAPLKGVLFPTSSIAKAILFCNLGLALV